MKIEKFKKPSQLLVSAKDNFSPIYTHPLVEAPFLMSFSKYISIPPPPPSPIQTGGLPLSPCKKSASI